MRFRMLKYDQRVLFNDPNRRKNFKFQFGGPNKVTFGYVALFIGNTIYVAEILK